MATFKPDPEVRDIISTQTRGNKFLGFWDQDIGHMLFMAKPTGSRKWMPARLYPERTFQVPNWPLSEEEKHKVVSEAKTDFMEVKEEFEKDRDKVYNRTEKLLAETLP